MAEISEGDPSAISSFKEIAGNKDLVYHGIGADIVALAGIASHGILSADKQLELNGTPNSNSPRELAKNKQNLVSVAKAPELGKPNDAFTTYVDHSPITFVIDSNIIATSVPADRGFYDEAFIEGASLNDVKGILLDGDSMDVPFASLPIVSGNVSPDVVAQKARAMMSFISESSQTDPAESNSELETMLAGLSHLTTENLQMTMGTIADADRSRIKTLDTWLQGKLSEAFADRFGQSDISVSDVVKSYFPAKKVYVNHHDAGVIPYTENEFFETLDVEDEIGYERYDGVPNRPSVVKIRKHFKAMKNPPEPEPT